MAEHNTWKEIEVQETDVLTGDRNQNRFLYYQLKNSMAHAEKIDIIVSFLMESGVEMLLNDFKCALERGARIRLLTGNYLGITQPSALYLLKRELGNQVELRFYNESGRSFHPKSYIFYGKEGGELYIGSSNMSKSGLTSGIEWNYRFTQKRDSKNFKAFADTFEDLFYHHAFVVDEEVLKKYSKNWHKPAVWKDLNRYEEREERKLPAVRKIWKPRGVQIEALYALENSRREGAKKGLVQAATGVGKTCIAAFDSKMFPHVLFIAHKEEILRQAAVTFAGIREDNAYGFFDGGQKDTDQPVIFASVATLGQEQYLTETYFAPEYFDYIVVDECHHAVATQYQRILSYFRPQFLLGLTATPERMDGRNVYEICDYNVAYEITLKDAINKGMLVPFHYYGVYDETDYSTLHVVKGHYVEKELNETYIGNGRRYNLIYKYYSKYGSRQALGFCCSKQHAEAMAAEFCQRGVPAVAVYSGENGAFSENREMALEKLKRGEIRVIFSVNMFNEGVDIPTVDMVMFLRPTESPVVFLQQLGRGLRKSRGKEYVTVLDFIGNYEKACKIPYFLGETRPLLAKNNKNRYLDMEFPDDCIVDFDMRLLDLFEKMEQRSQNIHTRIAEEYQRVKEYLGKIPDRVELFTYMTDDVYQLCMTNTKENPFSRYLDYQNQMEDGSEEWFELYHSIGREFLHLLETTNMQKVYKMPILYAFYHHGNVRMELTEEEVLKSWKEFFDTGTNWKDLKEHITYEEYRHITDRQHLSNAKRNPVKYLIASGQGFFIPKEGYVIALNENLRDIITRPVFAAQMKDIIEYRTMEYYRRRYEKEK